MDKLGELGEPFLFEHLGIHPEGQENVTVTVDRELGNGYDGVGI